MVNRARVQILVVWVAAVVGCGVLLVGCGASSEDERASNNHDSGGVPGSDGGGGERDAGTADIGGGEEVGDADETREPAEPTDPAPTDPVPIDVGGCEAQTPGALPGAELPRVEHRDQVYEIELERWGIDDNGRHASATTDGLNEAIEWAHGQGFGTVRLPAGQYLVGKEINSQYAGGVVLPGGLVFELDDDAVIQMAANDRWNYCVVEVSGESDVIITGGTIRGERDEHVFAGGGAHDEGHTICIWGESERVLVEKTTLRDGTGDGVLIVGGDETGSSRDITIRENEIFNHRRQGVSIVGGVNVLIEDNEIHHIAGTAPQFGIDIESMSYKSRDILIRGNHFSQNQGGDYVNTDGLNVWLVDNTMDQTGLEEKQTDGPIVHWDKTDQVIRGNTITVTVGSSNGRWGIIGYSRGERENPAPNFIEDNVFYGGGLHMADSRLLKVSGNIVNDWIILGTDIDCLQLDDNEVNYEGGEPYKFRRIKGRASGNKLNGEPEELPLSPDEPFTNSPPHMW